MSHVECNLRRMYAAYDRQSTMQASSRPTGTPIQIHPTIYPAALPGCSMFFSNTQLVVSQKETKKNEPQWSCLAYPAKVLWSGEDTTPFRQKRIQGVLWLIFFLICKSSTGLAAPLLGPHQIPLPWPSSQVNAVGRFLCERITIFHWQHQGHYPTSWPRKLLECWAIWSSTSVISLPFNENIHGNPNSVYFEFVQ